MSAAPSPISCCVDEHRDLIFTGKRLTTPGDPSEAIVDGIAAPARARRARPDELHSIVHGTTLVTNTVIERTGAKVGLITTAGFRDVIEMGREIRYDLYDLFLERRRPLVPRHRRREVQRAHRRRRARCCCRSTQLAFARRRASWSRTTASRRSRSRSCTPIAIRARAARGGDPRARVSASCRSRSPREVAPEIREFERTSTACANAYVQPLMRRYLERLRPARGASASRAGSTSCSRAAASRRCGGEGLPDPHDRVRARRPAPWRLRSLARLAGLDRVISFDMGGTTAKMCLIENGAPEHGTTSRPGACAAFARARACRSRCRSST